MKNMFRRAGRRVIPILLILCTLCTLLPGDIDRNRPANIPQQNHPSPTAIQTFLRADSPVPRTGFSASAEETRDHKQQPSSKNAPCLYVGGMNFGLQMQTDGILVAGTAEIYEKDGIRRPAEEAGLRICDRILQVNGEDVRTVEALTERIRASGGKTLILLVRRQEQDLVIRLKPALEAESGIYKAGLWARDGTAGIGTVTFISENGAFGGLGHGVYDAETGVLLTIRTGEVLDVILSGVNRGKPGTPGSLLGYFGKHHLGSILYNTEAGVYGVYHVLPSRLGEPITVGARSEVQTGPAQLRCCVENDCIETFNINIIQINRDSDTLKNFVIEITDPKLLARTGGIVQGMSGSPILQNGKLVGAVTHVLINDPLRGYGIFIDTMLRNIPDIVS